MPFSSLTEPADLARACCALDAAWSEISLTLDPPDERERTRLAYIVATLVAEAENEEDLTRRAIEKFWSTAD